VGKEVPSLINPSFSGGIKLLLIRNRFGQVHRHLRPSPNLVINVFLLTFPFPFAIDGFLMGGSLLLDFSGASPPEVQGGLFIQSKMI